MSAPAMNEGSHVHEYEVQNAPRHPALHNREGGSRKICAPHSEERKQRVYLAMHQLRNRTSNSLVMVDPDWRWERSPGLDVLTLLGDVPGSVRGGALISLKEKPAAEPGKKNTVKKRNPHIEKLLQVKNLTYKLLVDVFGTESVSLNNGLPFAHPKTPLVVSLEGGHKLFVEFEGIKGKGSLPKHEAYDSLNDRHSMINVLIHDTGSLTTTAADVTWSFSKEIPWVALGIEETVIEFVTRSLTHPLETCRRMFGNVRIGKPETSEESVIRKMEAQLKKITPEPTTTTEEAPVSKDEKPETTQTEDGILDIGKINLVNPSPEDLEKIKKLQAVFGGSSDESEDRKPKRLSKEDYIAQKKQAKKEKWESTDLYAKFHGTPLGEIAARPNHLFDYDESSNNLRNHNHDRGILAHVEHWHTLAIRALHDMNYTNGETIEIDEVLDFISDGLAEVDPTASDIKVGDNYPTRYLSVLAFYVANARDLGLDLNYSPATVEKLQKKRVVKMSGNHFAVTPSMGDESVVVDLIAQGNYGPQG